MQIKTIGIDLGKTACDVVAMDGRGKVVARRRLSRAKLVAWLANLPPVRIGMEASCGAHHLARRLRELGHEVRLMPAQYVRPFVKTNKHDQADAAGVAEAVQRPEMRFVPIKSEAQLDLQAVHRVRDRLITQRTGLINQIRAFLLERGITVRQGRRNLAKALPEVLEAERELSPMIRTLLAQLRAQWQVLDGEIFALDQQILSFARAHPLACRLMTVPGIGALIATALVAAIDTGQAFGRARDLACWLGLVPRQHTTGGKVRLLGIAKRGNGYLRRLLVHAARSLKRSAKSRDDRLGAWLRGLEARVHPNVATVALAAKLARWSWAVLVKNQAFRPAGAGASLG
jgi:transposase